MRFIAPDDGNPDDRTVAEVPLAAPVAPGETVNVQIAWSSRVPRTFARTGAIGNYYFLAQWFPKIGVLEDTGWNCHQFHAATEFFSDFGIYDVRLTVPSGWIVGATGAERGRRDEGDGTTTHHYYAEDVHDFAWTTSPDYVERTSAFEHPTACRPSSMRLLLQPEHVGQAERHFDATRAALSTTASGSAPTPTATSPSSIRRGRAAPTAWSTRRSSPPARAGSRRARVADPEDVTVHEAGHQFWYGIVATNEFEHAWMDEGLNTFSTARDARAVLRAAVLLASATSAASCPWVFERLAAQPRDRRQPPGGYRDGARRPMRSRRRRGATGRARRARSPTTRPRCGCNTLERMLGWDTLQRILSTYFARYAFKHPEPKDFFAVANEVSGRDLTWFFDQVYRSSSVFDYGVDVFTSEQVSDRGYLRRCEPADVLRRRAVRRRSIARRSSCAASATASSRSTSASSSRTTRKCAGSGTDATAGRCSRSIGRCARSRPGRSRARAAARRELHQQLAIARAEDERRGAQVVARLADLAAGSSADLWLLHLDRRTRMTAGPRGVTASRRVNGAPVVLLGMFALTLLVALPLSLALRGMIAAHLGDSLSADAARVGHELRLVAGVLGAGDGLGTTFVPSIIGFGAVLDNLSAILDNLPTGDDDRRRDCRLDGAVVVPERRRARSLRAHAAHARDRVLRRVRHALLALPQARPARLARLLGALPARPPVALRRSSIRG